MSSDGNPPDSAERNSMNGDLLTADEVARNSACPQELGLFTLERDSNYPIGPLRALQAF
jgi:hypothetical protein